MLSTQDFLVHPTYFQEHETVGIPPWCVGHFFEVGNQVEKKNEEDSVVQKKCLQ